MKKLILVLLIGLLVGTAVFADHDGFGIGLILGGGGYSNNWGFHPGISLKIPSIPIFWGIYTNWNYAGNYNNFGLTVTGDYYIIDQNIVSAGDSYKFILDWYFGLGGAVWMNFWNVKGGDNGLGVGLGLRVPVGLSWHVFKPFEIALGLIPTFGIYLSKYDGGFWWNIDGELILRVWIQ